MRSEPHNSNQCSRATDPILGTALLYGPHRQEGTGRRRSQRFPAMRCPTLKEPGRGGRACMWGSVAGTEEARAALMPLLFPLSIRTKTVTGTSHLLNFFSKKKKEASSSKPAWSPVPATWALFKCEQNSWTRASVQGQEHRLALGKFCFP